MRIAIDLSPAIHQKAGLGRYARTLAEHLVTQDRANEYVAFAYGQFKRETLSPALRALPQARIPLDARPWRMGVWLAHALHVPLDRALPRVDLFHATEHLLPPLKNARTVFTLHDLIFRLFPEYHLPLNHWFLRNAMPHFLRRADAIIAVSECTRQDAIRFYNVPPDKITVIYEGVNPALHPETDPERIRAARVRYAKGAPFIFFVSTIEPRKNIPALVDAVRVLRARGFPHRLVIAGRKGWLYQGVFAHVRESGMEGAVDFLDYVPDVDLPALFAACDAFVFPSMYEGFGLPPLEAMACGAAVVCSNTSSLPEVAGDAALFVNPRAVAEIAGAVERVITDTELRDTLRARGVKQAAKFSWERVRREKRSPCMSDVIWNRVTMPFAIDGRYIQDHFPGIGRYTFHLIDALARVAPEERLPVLHNPALRNTRFEIAALARHPNVELVKVDIPTFSLREQFQLPGAFLGPGSAGRLQLQLLHSPYYIKPYGTRVPSIVTIFDLLPLFYPQAVPNRRARFLFRWAVALAARTATRIIVPSISTRNDLATHLGVPRSKMTVIPLAADARFAPQPDDTVRRVREKYGLGSGYVLSVGINKPHKNIATLIEAWRRVGDASRTLVIAGAWDERYADLQREGERETGRGRERGIGRDVPAERLGVGGAKILFIHEVDDGDLPALYAGAEVFVTASFYEGFGLTPLEAMACGAPVIASNTSSLPEVVGDAALAFDPSDANALAERLQELLRDPARREEMRAKSLARASRFSWEQNAQDTLKVYRSA